MSEGKNEINMVKQIGLDCLFKHITSFKTKNEKEEYYKSRAIDDYNILAMKINDEDTKIRSHYHSLNHMADIAENLRIILRNKTDIDEINKFKQYIEDIYSVMRFIANCHTKCFKWDSFETDKSILDKELVY